jgi:hypothetical protein
MQHIRKHRIEYLYHMTALVNLRSILEHGLLSHNDAHTRRLLYRDISDPEVQQRRRKKQVNDLSLHDYACLYFEPRNPMLYVRQVPQSEIIILGIDRSILLDSRTIFSDGNAAADDTVFYRGTANLARLPWKIIRATYWNDVPDGKRIKCAEVLVHPQIEVTDIRKIYCSSKQQYDKVEQIRGNLPVDVVVCSARFFTGN